MSGVTDAPFRKQATRFGAPAVVTEMIAGSDLANGRSAVVRRLARQERSGPFIVQLAGREAKWMTQSAKIARDEGADLIDINMGCPSKQVTGGLSGAALMRNLDHAKELIEATLEGAQGPVSVKMRLGWDENSLNAAELAQIAESAGACMVTVHGRTRSQFYKGRADWFKIVHIVDAIRIPVVANGDIASADDAKLALKASGAKGVMIGRGATGVPWLVGRIAAALRGQRYDLPDLELQIASLCDQVHDSAILYGESLGVRTVRKHISAFIDKCNWLDLSATEKRALRSDLCRIEEADALISAISNLLSLSTSSRMELETC